MFEALLALALAVPSVPSLEATASPCAHCWLQVLPVEQGAAEKGEVGYPAFRVIEPVPAAEVADVVRYTLPDNCLSLWAVVPRQVVGGGAFDPPTHFAVLARQIPGCVVGD